MHFFSRLPYLLREGVSLSVVVTKAYKWESTFQFDVSLYTE